MLIFFYIYLVLRSLKNYFVHIRVIQMIEDLLIILEMRDRHCFVFDAFCL